MCRRHRHTPRLRTLSEEEPQSAPELIVDVRIAHTIEELTPLDAELQLGLPRSTHDREVGRPQPRQRDGVVTRVVEVPQRQAGPELHAPAAHEPVSNLTVDETA